MNPRDQYGNPVGQTDEYGNPVQHTGTMGSYGTGQAPTVGTGGAMRAPGAGGHQGGLTGKLHRSGSSSSSSSSEDDGLGGRRKKGLKEKVKDKLPGSKDQHGTAPAGQHPQKTGIMDKVKLPGSKDQHGTAPAGQHPQKTGIMEKVKNKLPGTHTNNN